jgi:polysaccharide pyruvyl transferase CsaB
LLIAGEFGYAHTGAEAILAVMVRDLRARRPDVQCIVVSGEPEQTAVAYGVQAIAAHDMGAIVDAGRAVDGVVLGGGGLFHDYWGCPTESLLTRGQGKLPFVAAFPLLAGLTGRPCMIYGVGVGPLLTAEGGRLTRGAFEQSSVATVRDEESRETLRRIGVDVSRVQVTADPAFGLSVDEAAGRKVLSELGMDPARPTVAVCVRPWTIGVSAAWAEGVAAGLEAFVEQTGANLVFLPFQRRADETTDDVAVAEQVLGGVRAGTRVALVRSALAPEVMAGVVGACDLVVGMRMHAVIFAALTGVPVVGLVYDAKVASVMRRLGQERYAVPLGEGGRLGERLAAAWAERAGIRAELAPRVAELRTQAGENATIAVNLLEARPPRRAHLPEAAWLAEFALTQTRKLAAQQALAEQLAAEAEVESLTRQMATLSAQLSRLTGSVGWRFLEAARDARERLAPRGTRRDRVIRGGLSALVELTEHGWRGIVAPGRQRRRHKTQLGRILAEHRGRRAVIFLPTVDWGWMRQRPQQLARALVSRGCLVFYMTGQRRKDHVDGFAEVGDGLYLCADLTLLRRIANPIVITANLRHLAEVPRLRHPFVIYDVLDVLEISGPVTPAKLSAHAQLLAGASMVMVTSRRLLDEARKVRPDALLIPNACDPEHFAPDRQRAVPGDLAEMVSAGGPIAGYYGALAEWFDYDLLDAVAERLPHWSFVLIGPDYDGTVARLPARRNVRWLGLKDYAALPAYLQRFDVAMIPFVINEITRATSPVKLFEYMAGDRPIVTTPIEEAQGYASVHIADGAEAFATALETAYAGREDAAARRVRRTERDANTWAARAGAILDGVAAREAEPRDVAVVLGAVATDDSKNSDRPAHRTLALLARGWRVIYVHEVARTDQHDLGLGVDHPRLETCDVAEFDVAAYLDPASATAAAPGRGGGRLLGLVEAPNPAFERVIGALRTRGARVVYDMIDDWRSIDTLLASAFAETRDPSRGLASISDSDGRG